MLLSNQPTEARHTLRWMVLLLAVLVSPACSSPDDSIFPMQEGYWWQYRISRSTRGELHIQKRVEANLGTVTVNGENLVPRKHPNGQLKYFLKTSEGIFQVYPGNKRRVPLLREPIAVGTRWQADSRILYLEVTGAFKATYDQKIREAIPIDYRIESIDDSIEVAAGKFRNCVRVTGKGSIYGGGGSLKEFMAIDTINIETTEWYAPGVGLVKRQRREFTYPLAFENHYLEELENFRGG